MCIAHNLLPLVRRERDSNPRNGQAVHRISSPAQSVTLASLLVARTAYKGTKENRKPRFVDSYKFQRFGDFEMDLIIGAQQREAILTLTERKTGYAIIEKLPNGKNAKSLDRVVNRSLAYFKRMGLLHSITTDNGSEFMAFRSIERALRIPVFFAKPYCSTDKPHVELLNKLIRQYIPKGTSFKDVDDKQIRNIRMLLNNGPRKSLDFKSPNEVLALLLSYRCT